jgi:hypothetical protein
MDAAAALIVSTVCVRSCHASISDALTLRR